MRDRFVVVPTRGVHKALERLSAIIFESGATPLVLTSNPEDVDATRLAGKLVAKTGTTFNSWINQGMDLALSLHDQPRVVVMNDDISIFHQALDPLFEALEDSDLAYMSGRNDLVTPSPLTPHLFGMRPTSMRMEEPDGIALWWWNSDDLYHQAVADGKRIKVVPELEYRHVSLNERGDGSWRYPPEFQWSVQADHDYFWSKWHHLDPEHRGCYLSWWPDSLPEGQVHRTEWS